MYGKSLGAYQQKKLEALDPGALLILCFERIATLIRECPPLIEAKKFEAYQIRLDKIFDHITVLLHACEEGRRDGNPLMVTLTTYLVRMQVAMTRAAIQKSEPKILRISHSFAEMAALMRSKNEKVAPPAMAYAPQSLEVSV